MALPGTDTRRENNVDIAIVGGGIAGLTLAIALHHRGVPVKLYEQAPAFGEIGAGVSFSPHAVAAMRECHEGVYNAFNKVCTRNLWPSKQKVWFDCLDGFYDGAKHSFAISNSLGQNGVHRAHYLAELIPLFPQDRAYFGKKLADVTEKSNGKIVMEFEDGTTAQADAVIGCDGIKSRVRQVMFGAKHPCAFPSYTHKYAYRGLVPIGDAIAAIGKERAENACMHVSFLECKPLLDDKILMWITSLDGT